MGPRLRSKQARDSSPDSSAEHSGQNHDRYGDDGGHVSHPRPGSNPGRADPAKKELALGPNIEQASPKGNCQRQGRADEGHRAGDRASDPVRTSKHPLQQEPVGGKGIDADNGDQDSTNQNGQESGRRRERE